MNGVIFAGAFDPFTKGHSELVRRACELFPKVCVAVASDTQKKHGATLAERENIVRLSLSDVRNVTVCAFEGLLTDFAKTVNMTTLLRGLRSNYDFEYERSLMEVYRRGGLNCIYLFSLPEHSHISSTIVRELALLGGDIRGFVEGGAIEAVQRIYKRQK